MASDWNGLPENPERDGWHWLQDSRDFPIPARWVAELHGWADSAVHSPQGIVELGFHYLGPCLTPADHAAAVEAAVQAERADCARHIDARVAGWRNAENPEDETVNGYLAFAGQLLSHEIRARGPADALARIREGGTVVVLAEMDDCTPMREAIEDAYSDGEGCLTSASLYALWRKLVAEYAATEAASHDD